MQKNLAYKLLTTSCLSGCSIDSSMNISNTYTTNVYYTTHACVKFVKTQFFCPKELHVHFHPISLPILTQLQNITACCMLGQCDECNDHGLKPEDFEKTLSAGHSDSDSEEREFDRTIGVYEWKRSDNG